MARIADLLAAGRTFSFEFFPPKTDGAQLSLGRTHRRARAAGAELRLGHLRRRRQHAPAHPRDRHLGAAGDRRSRRWPTSRARATPAPRSPRSSTTTARPGSRTSSPSAAIRRPTADVVPSELHVRRRSDRRRRPLDHFSIGVAAHPEVHPARPTATTRPAAPRRQAARAPTSPSPSSSSTPSTTCGCATSSPRSASTSRSLPGIMPITNVGQVARMAQMSGADVPALGRRAARRCRRPRRGAPGRRRRSPPTLCAALLDDGAPGLHFYTLNRSTATREIYANLGWA